MDHPTRRVQRRSALGEELRKHTTYPVCVRISSHCLVLVRTGLCSKDADYTLVGTYRRDSNNGTHTSIFTWTSSLGSDFWPLHLRLTLGPTVSFTTPSTVQWLEEDVFFSLLLLLLLSLIFIVWILTAFNQVVL